MTSFRKINEDDDITRIARGIYYTDKFLFNILFGNEEFSIDVISHLITSKYINQYHKNFITLIYDENPKEIEGFVVGYKGSDVSFKSTYKSFEKNNIKTMSIILNIILCRFFASKIKNNDYYIGNLYVFEQYRHKGNGSKLIEKSKQIARQQNSSSVLLDVEYDKDYLLGFYKKFGFKRNSKNYHRILGKTYGCYGLKCTII